MSTMSTSTPPRRRKHISYIRHFIRDLLIIAGSILVASVLVKLGVIESFISVTSGSKILSSFIAGIFFTSVFTIAPAAVALVAISQSYSPILVALFGAIGATIVDLLLASFVRKDVVADIEELEKMSRLSLRYHVVKAFHFGFLKWIAFGLGVFIIASPFPDEFGLLLIGFSKIKTPILPFLFFIANFLGIWALVSIAAAVGV